METAAQMRAMLMSTHVPPNLFQILESRVEESLKGIEEEMQKVLGRREKILKTSRDCISFCSKAIIHIHTGKLEEAQREIKEADSILKSLRKEAGGGTLTRYLASPEAEFVEASSVEAIVLGRPIPRAKELGVSGEGYLLGLLDTVGEVKRLLLDAIMRSEIEKARRYFEMMEALYSLLSPFAVYDHVANGVRRKIDVARMLTEDVRGVMAEEARRSKLVSSMQDFQASLERKGRRDGRGKAKPAGKAAP
jgi:translin